MLCSSFSYRAAGSRSAKMGISAFRKHKKKRRKKKGGGLGGEAFGHSTHLP